jgi:hypothetical protein
VNEIHSCGYFCDKPTCIKAQRNELRDKYLLDALRYRWLKEQKNLSLRSEGSQWTRQDGTKFISTHILCAGDTQFGPAESLDENIDAARSMDLISAGKHLETQAKS